MFNLWVKPLFVLLSFFGLAPLFVIEDDLKVDETKIDETKVDEVPPTEKVEEEPLVITDDTDLLRRQLQRLQEN